MHDCPKTQEKMLDLVLNETDPREQKQLLDDVASCALCRAELESFEKTLALYDRAAAFYQPTAAEWQTYESNLQKQFVQEKSTSSPFWRRILFGTIRVPAPVLAASALFVCSAAFFAFRPVENGAPQQFNAETVAAPSAGNASSSSKEQEEKIVVREVERVVTQKVYIVKQASSPKRPKASVAQTQIESDSSPLNLAEFKPVRPISPSVVKEDKP